MTGGKVVILGSTGKNFAAGMSGGVAYVLDRENDFHKNLNPELVDLEPLDLEDKKQLRHLLRRHFLYTGSNIALEILNNWEEENLNFKRVMGREYRTLLTMKKSAKGNKPKAAM